MAHMPGSVWSGSGLMRTGPDQYGAGVNMDTGNIGTLTDASMSGFDVIIVKGADNQGTFINGIDATGVSPGAVRLLLNLSESGVDVGIVVIRHNIASATATDRVLCPQACDYKLPVFGAVWAFYGDDRRWHLVSESGMAQVVCAQALRFYPHFYGPSVSGTYNNWNPTAQTSYTPPGTHGLGGGDLTFEDYTAILVPTTGDTTLTGLSPNDGSNANIPTLSGVKFLLNTGSGNLTLKHLDGGSTSGRQFICPNAEDVVLKPYECAWVFTPGGDMGEAVNWRVIACSQSNRTFPSVTTTGRTTTNALSVKSVTGAALAVAPTVTHDYDPGNTNTLVRIEANANGSILDSLTPADATSSGRGEVRVVTNVGNGPLVILDAADATGGTAGYRFETPGGRPIVLLSNESMWMQRDDTDRWKAHGLGARTNAPVDITPAVLAATNVDDWAPVGASGANAGLSFLYANWIKAQGAVGTVLRTINPGKHGDRKFIYNYASGFTIKHLQGTGTTGKSIYTPGGADFVLSQYAGVWIQYDGASTVWILDAY